MASLIENIRARVPEGILNFNNGSMPTNMSSILTSLANVFKNSVSSCSEFASAFAAEWDFIDDYMIKSSYSTTEADVFFETDSRDLADTLSSIVQRYGVTEDFGYPIGEKPSITITLVDGKILKLFTMGGSIYSYDGVNSYAWPVAVRIAEGGPTQIFKTRVYYLVHALQVNGIDQYGALIDTISDLMENSAISNTLYQATVILLNGEDSVGANFLNLINLVDSKWDSVKSICTRLYSSWNTGGVYGVIRTLIDIIKGVPSVSLGSDGFLTFTQGGGLMPQAYTAGIIQVASSVASAVVSAIVAVWSPVVAILISSLTGLITSLVSAYQYNEDVGENASIIDSIRSVGGLAPHFMARGKFTLTEAQFNNLKAIMPYFEYDNIVLIPVPGGAVISCISSEGQVSFEFHPDVVDRTQWAIQSKLIFAVPGSVGGVEYPGGFDATIERTVLLEGLRTGKIPEYSGVLANTFTGWSEDDPIIFDFFRGQNTSSGALSSFDTKFLGLIVGVNEILFYIFMASQLGDNFKLYGWLHHDNVDGFICIKYETGQDRMEYIEGHITDNRLRYLMALLSICCNVAATYIHPQISPTATNVGDIFSNLAKVSKVLANVIPGETPAISDNGLVDTLTISGQTITVWYATQFLDFLGYSYPTAQAATANMTGEIVVLSSNLEFFFSVPKYKPGSVLLGTIRAAIITALTVAVVAVVSVVAVRKIKALRAKNTVMAEKAWDDFKQNPTDENYNKYVKAVRKNNAFVKIFGGNSLSRNGYWDSTATSSEQPANQIISRVGQQVFADQAGLGSVNNANSSAAAIIRILKG